MKKHLLIFSILIFCSSCNQQTEQKPDFIEVRITRSTALEGGETFVLRKIGKDWSASLLGNGYRFSCLYVKPIQPESNWENLWESLQKEGLLEISDGWRMSNATDGSSYFVEINYQDKLKRYLFENPNNLKTKEAEHIQNIGNLISNEFETPMFFGKYDRGKVGDYLIGQCKSYSGQNSFH